MNRHPPQPLDAEERALAAKLPRAPGRSEPGPELDARILAAARAAVQAPARKQRRRSWIAPLSVAASLVLAVGLAWQLRPLPAPHLPPPATDTAAPPAATAETAEVAMPDIAAPPPPAMKSIAVPTPRAVASRAPVDNAAAPMAAPPAAPPPPPPPAPAAAPVAAEIAAPAPMAAPQMAEPAAAAAMAKASATEAARARATQARSQQDAAAAMAADAAAGEADDPGEDVPPATANSPEVRDAWLRRIGELLKQGKQDQAKESLAEFRRRYPEAVLPQELRKLEH